MDARSRKILESVLAAVPEKGWTAQAFAAGVRISGVPAARARKSFPRGIADVVEAFHRSIDDAMRVRIGARRNFAALRVRDKITFAVRARLEAAGRNREAVRRLLAWSLMPRHIRQSAAYLWQAADAVWRAAGDTSTDYNYYTKRLLLIAVMKSTLSFWLNDQSKDCRESWEFLDRRIADVMTLGKGISLARNIGFADIASFVRSRLAA